MEDLGEKLKAMLSDPAGVEKIMGIARALGEKAPSDAVSQPEKASPSEESKEGYALASVSGKDSPLQSILSNPELKRLFGSDCQNRNRLLRAMCPFLSAEKREKLERILKATSTVEMLYSAGSILG